MAHIRSQNAKDLQITVQDCTLPGRAFESIATRISFDSTILPCSDSNDFGPGAGHLDYDMKMAYQATLDRTFILQQVARVLQEPEESAEHCHSWWQCQTSLDSCSCRCQTALDDTKAMSTDLRSMYEIRRRIIYLNFVYAQIFGSKQSMRDRSTVHIATWQTFPFGPEQRGPRYGWRLCLPLETKSELPCALGPPATQASIPDPWSTNKLNKRQQKWTDWRSDFQLRSWKNRATA